MITKINVILYLCKDYIFTHLLCELIIERYIIRNWESSQLTKKVQQIWPLNTDFLSPLPRYIEHVNSICLIMNFCTEQTSFWHRLFLVDYDMKYFRNNYVDNGYIGLHALVIFTLVASMAVFSFFIQNSLLNFCVKRSMYLEHLRFKIGNSKRGKQYTSLN